MARRVSEESRCDSVIAQVVGAGCVVQFARRGRRASGTSGLPDRLYFLRGRALWWEVKEGVPRRTDHLSQAQYDFLSRVLASDGGFAGCGDADALRTLITLPTAAEWRRKGKLQVLAWHRTTRSGVTIEEAPQ